MRCSYTTAILGRQGYSYTTDALIAFEDGLITTITFGTTTEPADLRSHVQDFFATEATDDDLACIILGFNTTGCGRHDADFMARYLRFYETQSATEQG